MDIYSEYQEGDRKATVTRLHRSWDKKFDIWEVALYIQGKPIQRSTCQTDYEAEQLAEDFVKGSGGTSPTLLNEYISNNG